MTKGSVKLNLGCGGRPLKGYINIDMDTLDQIRVRYPDAEYSDDIVVEQYDLFALPYADSSIDEVNADGLIEHLPFIDEPKFFYEVTRVLKPGGILKLSTVDFEATVKQWLEAKDEWIDFYRDDDEAIKSQHWFGTYTYKSENRWGYLAATLYGSQNGAGQFHTNCYTDKKLEKIMDRLNFQVISLEKFKWKGDRDNMLQLIASKREFK